jgi:hypothetical protein
MRRSGGGDPSQYDGFVHVLVLCFFIVLLSVF